LLSTTRARRPERWFRSERDEQLSRFDIPAAANGECGGSQRTISVPGNSD
jgi:hypothetical protein